ncbi:hypothetical protein IFM89_023470 [Coptis chinensis]|uniref:J domain-containing protein n=1 Tax=Coptis chinensis TaxID=261450 RepID=A0A835LK99_9MAGN|nr:hypothetical protein IFM89_023470 [Coptis chinensis]
MYLKLVLGVERDASQRQIQKAFHKLSLQYHPDKNKNKGAEEKFAEINNAYDILSDEEKRKNYDLYGDEKGNARFESGNPGGHEGYTHFTSGGPGNSHFSFDPSEWQTTGGQGNSKSFSFSFGGNPSASGSSFGFDVNDIFSNFFGGVMGGGSQFGGFGGSSRTRSQPTSSKNIQAVNSLVFKNEILEQGITWILLSYVPSSKGYHVLESIVEEVASQLQGALKAGSINCQKDQSLCKELGLHSRKSTQVFVYSYKSSDKGTVAEYNGALEAKSLKSFCQDQLPRFSRRVNVAHFDYTLTNVENLPRVLLLSTKKDTPVIWRALSGLYRRRIMFYDAEVHDVFDPAVKSLGVDALPAVVGWLSNGEKHVLKTGITVKDLKSAISELSGILDKFEKKSKKTASSQPKSSQQTDTDEKHLPLLTKSNLDSVCGESTPVCVIGAFRSSNGKEMLESILSTVSKKSLTRRQNQVSGSEDSISFSLLDANKQQEFLNSMDKTSFKSKDNSLVAYKPRKGKFAAFTNVLTLDEVERFIGAVLNGDVRFSKMKRKPVLK